MVAIAKPKTPPLRPKRARTLPRWRPLPLDALPEPDEDLFAGRPKTRGDCKSAPGPCPWIACRHHLYLEVHPRTGSIKLNFPDVPPDELHRLPATCSLDVADAHRENGLLLSEIATYLGALGRERVRQVEIEGLGALRARMAKEDKK